MMKACYRKLHGYKYQLMEPYQQETEICGYIFENPYLRLEENGFLEIRKTYAWDGPSGPTIDTPNFMRGSLVHDALYQLIRLKVIPFDRRDDADQLLRTICREDGMSAFRAWYVYQAVKLCAAGSAKPGNEKPIEIICVPEDR